MSQQFPPQQAAGRGGGGGGGRGGPTPGRGGGRGGSHHHHHPHHPVNSNSNAVNGPQHYTTNGGSSYGPGGGVAGNASVPGGRGAGGGVVGGTGGSGATNNASSAAAAAAAATVPSTGAVAGVRPGMGAWQPTAPTSLQQAAAINSNAPPGGSAAAAAAVAAAGGFPPSQQPTGTANTGQSRPPPPPPQAVPPPPPPGAAYHGQPMPYHYPHHHPYGQPPYPRGSWQGPPSGYGHPGAGGAAAAAAAGSSMRGGIFYPPQHQQQPHMHHHHQQPPPPGAGGMPHHHHHQHHRPPPQTGHHHPMGGPPPNAGHHPHYQAPPPAREKRILKITDKAGNLIDLSAAAPKKSSSSLQVAAASSSNSSSNHTSSSGGTSSSDAGAKLRQAALERIHDKVGAEDKKKKEAEEKARLEAEEKVKKEAEEKERLEAEEKTKEEAEEKARLEAELKAKEEAEEKSRKEAEEKSKKEAEERAKKEAEEKARLEAEEKAAEEKARVEAEEKLLKEAEEKAAREGEERARMEGAKSSLQALLDKETVPSASVSSSGRRVFNKEQLLRLKDLEVCQQRPESLPDMTITRMPSRGKSTGGRAVVGGNEWSRATQPPRRQPSTENVGGRGGGGGGRGDSWARARELPKPQNQRVRSQGGGGGRGRFNNAPYYDGPVAPLVKSENRWKPRKNTSAMVIAEKQVKSILNKMTKEKFERLAGQMLEIPIHSYEMLSVMIDNVYDKAIDEPAFGEIYAELCVRLSKTVQGTKFVHIIESDEEPPTEDGTANTADRGVSSSHTVYRWSNDVSTSDAEVVGPLPSSDACVQVAMTAEDRSPVERGDMFLDLVSVSIRRGVFIKVLKKQDPSEGEENIFYTVYFPVSDAKECGQQLSEIFLSQLECTNDASKKNSFKRSLLNKCEEEFNKQDIYVDWKKEKATYEETKSSLKEAERAEKEEELNFRRIRIKKQMLGNIKFIGQLYKVGLLKEKIMRYCTASLLKLEELSLVKSKNPEYKDSGSLDMDEEDHEAICSMFGTIGSTIDKPAASDFLNVCFTKIRMLSTYKALPSRSRFMYKDLLELRGNRWVPRRKQETSKTLEEIRKDVEKEELQQAQERAAANSGGGGGGGGRNDYGMRGGGGGRGGGDYRGTSMRSSLTGGRPRQVKQVTETDEDGFTTVVAGSKSTSKNQSSKGSPPGRAQQQQQPVPTKQMYAALAEEQRAAAPASAPSSASPPSKPPPQELSEEVLERRIKSMRSDFMSDGGNIDELMLSMEEISGTPEHGVILVTKNTERMMDCKDNEREAINKIITTLFEKGRLSSDDIKAGLLDAIEFVDSSAMDAPRAYEYLGDLLGPLLRINAIDVIWLCEQCAKIKATDPKSAAPQKLVKCALKSIKSSAGADAARSIINEKALQDLLGSEKWADISRDVL